ncbi:MAG: ABC transporter ATP-binding protein [Alphaproteobacteria bacterium]|nr:ABC transporter ATP-binding protein [Alphaproteobacteria bacterium]
MISVEDLRKDYRMGGHVVHALAGVSVDIAEGEFTAVMGPSGSGKSTFMNVIGCLDRPTAGRYVLAGQDVGRLGVDQLAALRNKRIGFVFQSFHLLPRATALANVEMPMIYGGVKRSLRHEKAMRALGRVGLSERCHHRPNQLSGGQQQRVAIARALVNDPSLILADEPTGALDSRTSLEIMALFQELNRAGMTVVMVTHEPDVAQFARRVLRFRDGKLIEDRAQAPADPAAMLAAHDGELRAA